MAKDYYKILGVSREASPEELRKAYRKIVRENHPDANPDDPQAAERFKEATEAYSVLKDSEKREQYDRYGSFPGGGAGGPGAGGTWSWSGGGGPGEVDLEELFGSAGIDLGDLFGGRRGAGPRTARTRAAPRKGSDQRVEIRVPFRTAVLGGTYDLRLQRDGQPERLEVKVPAGVSDGSVIRLAGEGGPGQNGGPAGDLLLTVDVAPHPWFRREDHNLVVDVPVTPAEAALGAKVEVPTLDEGQVMVTVPPGTSSGTRLRLREQGVRNPKTGTRGDLFAVVKIVVPKELDEETRQLYEQLAQRPTPSPRAGRWS